VETTEDLVIDLDDLQAKAAQTGARVLLLSHMRGHVVDMEKLMAWADAAGVAVIEDCAHTMGATWNGCKIGNFGKVACFSCQTYKHLNAGEGGFVTTQDPDVAARATILSGSYMLFDRHGAGPNAAAYGTARYEMPNSSARMDNLRAAILIPQVDDLDRSLARWMNRARIVNQALMTAPGIVLPISSPHGQRVGSSIQWRLPHFDAAGCERFVARCADRGVEVKWFGASAPAGFTSAHASWRFVAPQALPRTDRILSTLFDMRLPLTFSRSDCLTLGRIIVEVANDIQEAVV
jgi:dTDP-4-amino-4,6-dideoxygalactose transaminase